MVAIEISIRFTGLGLQNRMEQVSPTAKDLAVLVFADERSLDSGVTDCHPAIQRTFEKLDRHLTVRFGAGGYHTLLKRAISLATMDAPMLSSITVSQSGAIAGFQELLGPDAACDACVAILTRLIELLDTFIGRNLTARILRNSWPNAVRIEEVSQAGESNE